MTGVTGPGWAEQYAYDPAGNITAATWPAPPDGAAAAWAGPGVQGPREYAGTLISRAGDIRYRHDAQGRIVTRQQVRLSRKRDTWHYTWDADNHLTTVTTPDGTTWRYRYDPLGRRIAKQRLTRVGSVAEQTHFTWDGPVLAEQATAAARPAWLAIPDGRLGPGPAEVITWDYRPDTFTPLTQTERISAARYAAGPDRRAVLRDRHRPDRLAQPNSSAPTETWPATSSTPCGARPCGNPAAPPPRCASPASTTTPKPACTTTTTATTTRPPAAT